MSGDASDLNDLSDEGMAEEEIVHEMDEVRDKLGGEIDRLGDDMRNVFDWQSYVRSAPLTSIGIAAVAGYLLAPAIRSRPVPQPIQLAPEKSGGLFESLTSLALSSLVRFGMGYVSELLMPQAAASPGEKRSAPVSSSDPTLDLGP